MGQQAGLEELHCPERMSDFGIEQQPCWFVLRDLKRTNAKLPAYQLLQNLDFEVFTPMKEQLRLCRGKKIREQVPFIRDLLFVHDTRENLDPVLEIHSTIQYRFQKGEAYRSPMVVPTAEMERFIYAVRQTDHPKYYLPCELTPDMYGREICIQGGPMDGFAGKLLKMRGSKKKILLVEMPGFFSAGVEVSPDFIKLL